ncbi:putative polyketide hydroxylase, partial [Solanum tuberosum]
CFLQTFSFLLSDFDQIASPVSVAHFSLYKLSRILLKHLEKLGFHMVNSEKREYGSIGEREIFMGHECIAINGADHGVTVTASFLSKGKYATRDIQCHFLVGTDGTGRSVRKSLGISMRGEKDLQKLVSVHFLSQELGQYLINGRPGMLFFIFNKDAIGVLIAHDLKQGKFVLQVPFYPPQHKLEDFSSEMCKRLMFKLAGLELKDVNVMDIKPWVMHLEVAEKFLSCNNRIILAGDAAHRFSPAGGFRTQSVCTFIMFLFCQLKTCNCYLSKNWYYLVMSWILLRIKFLRFLFAWESWGRGEKTN